MTKLAQIKGRSGYYLIVAVPRALRGVIRSSKITKKAGDTRAEALRNRPELLLQIEQRLREAAGSDPIAKTFEAAKPEDGSDFVWELERNMKAAGHTEAEINTLIHGAEAVREQGLEVAEVPKLEARLKAAEKGITSYLQWMERRRIEELPTASTYANWKSRLSMLSKWLGSEFVGAMSKQQAVEYKSVLLGRNSHQSVRTAINTLKSFWSWAEAHGEVSENIWTGLTRKLASSPKKEAITLELMDAARAKADELHDIQFWIQITQGCRKGDHGGLRWCDIDTDKRVIRYENWEADGKVRRLKGKAKDEREVPINSLLLSKLELMLPEAFTNNSFELIWSDDYKPALEAWAVKWAERFTDRYKFSSHNLRSYVVTKLINSNVSLFVLYEITRHKVPGMSEVVSGYVRPTLEELRPVVENLG